MHVLRDCDGDNFDSVGVLLHDGVQVLQQEGHHDARQRAGPDRRRGHLQPGDARESMATRYNAAVRNSAFSMCSMMHVLLRTPLIAKVKQARTPSYHVEAE